jgi:hypothetical protein
MLAQFSTLLEDIVRTPDKDINNLSLTKGEIQPLIYAFNDDLIMT